MYSLEQLRGFVAVAEELHFGRAAARLNMTQPPLTRQIQKLERAINVQLFERDRRNVVLTPAGKAFLAEAQKVLSLAESAPDLARKISAGTAGIIQLGFTAAATFGLLGELITTLAAELPDVHVDLHEFVTREQLAALERGEIDLGLARPPFDPEVFASRLLFSETMVVAAPAGHALARLGRPLTADDLVHEDLIMHSPTKARYFYDLVVRRLPVSNTHFVHTVSQILTMVSLVAAGRGIALVPRSARSLGIRGVKYLELAETERVEAELHAVWLKDATNPALHRVVAALPGATSL